MSRALFSNSALQEHEMIKRQAAQLRDKIERTRQNSLAKPNNAVLQTAIKHHMKSLQRLEARLILTSPSESSPQSGR